MRVKSLVGVTNQLNTLTSLLPGSSQKVGISKFKKDVHDHSIGISSKIVKAMNGRLICPV
jgi:hypothetical protein